MGVEGTINGRIHLIYIIYRETLPQPLCKRGEWIQLGGIRGGLLVLTENKRVNIVSVRRDNTICKGVTIPRTKTRYCKDKNYMIPNKVMSSI